MLLKLLKKKIQIGLMKSHSLIVQETCKEAFLSESKLIDWIFEKGELDFLPKNVIKEFIKNRFNNSLEVLVLQKYLM